MISKWRIWSAVSCKRNCKIRLSTDILKDQFGWIGGARSQTGRAERGVKAMEMRKESRASMVGISLEYEFPSL